MHQEQQTARDKIKVTKRKGFVDTNGPDINQVDAEAPFGGMVMTVTGPVDRGDMDVTLPHERVMSTFGAEQARYPNYDVERRFDQESGR